MSVVRLMLGVVTSWAILGRAPQAHEPQEWMTGVFSNVGEGASEERVNLQRIYLDPDARFGWSFSNLAVLLLSREPVLTWEVVDENTVRMPIPEEDQQGGASVAASALARM